MTDLVSAILSRSVFFLTDATYAATSSLRSSVVNCSTSSLSGASTMNVTPNTVSARVVKIVIGRCLSPHTVSKTISVPSERPIQLRCISFSESDQSRASIESSRRPAYADTRSCHCVIFFCSTGYPPLTLNPSFTSSLARTVPSPSHQLTDVSP